MFLCLVILKGDYDDELNWPFTADMVVDILNWRGDNNHHRVVLQFNRGSSNSACARVYDNNKVAPNASGYAKAIEISIIPLLLRQTHNIFQKIVCVS